MFPVTFLFLSFVVWVCWRLYFRRRFLRTVLDVVPGPPGQSWITGEDHCFQEWNSPWLDLDLGSLDQLSNREGWEFHRHIAETCKCESLPYNFLIFQLCIIIARWAHDTNQGILWGILLNWQIDLSISFKWQANNLYVYDPRALYHIFVKVKVVTGYQVIISWK